MSLVDRSAISDLRLRKPVPTKDWFEMGLPVWAKEASGRQEILTTAATTRRIKSSGEPNHLMSLVLRERLGVSPKPFARIGLGGTVASGHGYLLSGLVAFRHVFQSPFSVIETTRSGWSLPIFPLHFFRLPEQTAR